MAREAGQIRDEQLDAQEEARRLSALAQVRRYGDPVLRMKAREVERFDDDLRRLAERMRRLMVDAHGVGLAGNQVGVLQRVLVLQTSAEEEPRALVNPRIVESSAEATIGDEGCLSLRGVIVPVERAVRVRVEAQDVEGRTVQLDLADLAARVVQHEIDHLDGVLILDRTAPESRRAALALLRPEPVLG